MDHLPLLLDLSGRKVVIFGGGIVGERKARLFSQYAEVTVASLAFSPGLQEMAEEGAVDLVEADLSRGADDLLRDAFIAIPATSDRDLNLELEEKAEKMGVLVNRVDGVGEVVVPSVIRRNPIVVAISTLGESPALSKRLRMRIEEVLEGGYVEMALLLGEMRGVLKGRVSDQAERKRILWEIISDEEVWRLLGDSYEKAYKRAGEHLPPDERDSLDAGDPQEGQH
ncbi:MAG: bifunctional precorrin-2 dehydrogenase/sirohydrochlorin ferrochelatase [Methanothrix sp.]|uniref:precorrin-2 dehydrogenase n=1 Tax=Methanothrix harundinacea TaxID=301375 RepID=A0A117LFV0_9EURY|nr:MAG: Uncharacterized protein XD72_0703 [Methanothrix harundinacea]MDD3709290.1 bifunctional precorrin-2 dehydrogenase/sirohydrochlorin ferrochelatase [Methanothrix sp.]MDI9398749.1 bifunctional precorrin-2 dehydrogenase/sirohydrochlorin ferrochelatase [Euryarchaeota archaeon]KUK97235.1 MAG: Uncharacterized protein XE07_0390 [Methanothrix harundinacea]MCP1391735.1 bifunctional precorrin-2 dehydrogenase/sirohydrochlorin ferrochelatase [Methanothrix harundinacea]